MSCLPWVLFGVYVFGDLLWHLGDRMEKRGR